MRRWRALGVVTAVLWAGSGLVAAAPADPGSAPAPGPAGAAATAAAVGGGSQPGEPAPAGRPDAAGPALPADCRRGPALCAGAAKVAVTPAQRHIDGIGEPRLGVGERRQRFHLGGFGVNPLQSTPDPSGQLDALLTEPAAVRRFVGSQGPEDLWVRALVLRQPGGPAIVLVTLDATGAGNVIQGRVVEAVAAATGILAGNVLFSQTHTHAGPDLQGLWGGVPEDWREAVLYPAAARAAREALAAATPVSLEVRHGPVPEHNRYRRPTRLDPDVDADTEATLLQARATTTGAVVASLLQYNAHPTSIDEPVRAPHPDFVLGAVDLLERTQGGVALYVNGPIADASSSGERPGCAYPADGAYGQARCRGEGIAAAALAFPVERTLAPTLAVRHVRVLLPVTNPLFLAAGAGGAFNRYYDFLELPVAELPLVGPAAAEAALALPQLTPTASAQVSRITLGGSEHGVELVTIPGEATGTFADGIRSFADPGAHVVLLGLTHASFGYILPEEEFSAVDLSGDAGFVVPYTPYEELVSLGPLTAPLLRAAGYAPLFDASIDEALPPVLTSCLVDPAALPCLVPVLRAHLDYGLRELGADLLPTAPR